MSSPRRYRARLLNQCSIAGNRQTRDVIKQNIITLMVAAHPKIQSQLSEVLAVSRSLGLINQVVGSGCLNHI